ncbi:sodium/potassium-transporting ATPase subunit beta-3b [Sardina pilchardus]|uniref:sodium/potassium-transporting ATPase subunit beta-3b n=1 Tax=Sardina pilchardus TaxID=27697 RepID=UPI002E13502E
MSTKEDKPAEIKSSWKDAIYNPRTGEFIGRTATSWALIFVFYLVFYGFLAGFFTLTMWVMLQTLSNDVPKYQDRVPSPGVVIRPKVLDISFNRSNPLDYANYVKHLENLLQKYNDTVQEKNDLCMVNEYTEQDEEQVKKVCQFKRSQLRQCSGLADTTFGYSEGKPCILVKMNRIIGLRPKGEPFINCTAKRDTPLTFSYYPPRGKIDKMFFPYYGKQLHTEYVQPLVGVKLHLAKEDYNTEITIECKVDGSNLKNADERDKFLGRVTFRVTVSE